MQKERLSVAVHETTDFLKILRLLVDFILATTVFMLSYFLAALIGIIDTSSSCLDDCLIPGVIVGLIEVILLQSFIPRQEFCCTLIIELFAHILKFTFTALIIVFVITETTGWHSYPFLVNTIAFPSMAIVIALWRFVINRYRSISATLDEKDIIVSVYGSGKLAQNLGDSILRYKSIPVKFKGYIATGEVTGQNILNTICEKPGMFGWMRQNCISLLIIADSDLNSAEKATLLYKCRMEGISYYIADDARKLIHFLRMKAQMLNVPEIETLPLTTSTARRLAKVIMDKLLSAILLVLLSPLLLLIAILIVLDTGFPILYSQRRISKHKRAFNMFKFRSMRKDSVNLKQSLLAFNETNEPLFKIRDDPRMTRSGRFLRRFSLDELPQLLNVITGRMSLVGPRPPLPSEVAAYTKACEFRFQILPGMTGIWQISGRSDLNFDEMIKLDFDYMKNQSIWIDIAIMLLTAPAMLTGRGSY